MTVSYSLTELLFFLLVYSFIGWVVEACFFTIKNKRLTNKGFLNTPFSLPYGIAAVLLIISLPTLQHNIPLQYVLTFGVLGIVWSLSEYFVKRIGRNHFFEWNNRLLFLNCKSMGVHFLVTAVYLIFYLIVHPFLDILMLMLPKLVITVIVVVWIIILATDFLSVLYTIHTSRISKASIAIQSRTVRLLEQITVSVWKRLQREYPRIQEPEDLIEPQYIFAEGLCFDKLVWVFLVSSFLGALIEMIYCCSIDGFWMNRSSLLYGMFSVVWGFGAVILTVTLQRLSKKGFARIFLTGFFIGGCYEYLCSVLSEAVFGTVFWDYSGMPLNIGGRTNLPYCVAWGILAVIWIKSIYPHMSHRIEKIPVLPGKCLTWILILLIACNGLLTAGAMMRYTDRQINPKPQNIVEEFLDKNFDDDWMEHRWPNMKLI